MVGTKTTALNLLIAILKPENLPKLIWRKIRLIRFYKNSRIWFTIHIFNYSIKKREENLMWVTWYFDFFCLHLRKLLSSFFLFQTFSARLWNGYHKSRPVNHSMSRLVPKHFDEKTWRKKTLNTTFLILMMIILMTITTTITNALLVDVCKIRKKRKTCSRVKFWDKEVTVTKI